MTCTNTHKCAEPCGLCPEKWPVPAGNEYGEPNLMQLIGEYFDLGVAEGRESRDHDTKDGAAQRKLSEIRAALANQSPAAPAQSAGVPAVQSPAEGDATSDFRAELPPLPEWSVRDDLGGLVPSEIRVALRIYARAAITAHEAARPNVQPKAAEAHGDEPAGWFEGPHGAFRANPAFRMVWPPQSLQWQIPLYLAPNVQPKGTEVPHDYMRELRCHAEDTGRCAVCQQRVEPQPLTFDQAAAIFRGWRSGPLWLHMTREVERAHGITAPHTKESTND